MSTLIWIQTVWHWVYSWKNFLKKVHLERKKKADDKQSVWLTRDDPKVLILAWYLCNQKCNMPENCTKYKYILCLYTVLTSFVSLEGETGNLPRNSHTLNTLTHQADCAYKRPHNSDKSSLSNSFSWLLSVHPLANSSSKYGELSIRSGFPRPLNVWLCNCQQ